MHIWAKKKNLNAFLLVTAAATSTQMEEERGAALDQVTTLVCTAETLQTLSDLLNLHLLQEDGSQVSNLTETLRHVCTNYCFFFYVLFPPSFLMFNLSQNQQHFNLLKSYFCHKTKIIAYRGTQTHREDKLSREATLFSESIQQNPLRKAFSSPQ